MKVNQKHIKYPGPVNSFSHEKTNPVFASKTNESLTKIIAYEA